VLLFPEKINGTYCRLERPMPVYSIGGRELFDMWMSFSPDLIRWGNSRLVLAQEDVPFSNCKVGPSAPPIRTEKRWLTLFHAVKKDARLIKKRLGKKMEKSVLRGDYAFGLRRPVQSTGHLQRTSFDARSFL
jgi:beta-1,4-mannooligosaccharide/beta-1,4-mannosyl-N-acetylglucosamine phosphorylase